MIKVELNVKKATALAQARVESAYTGAKLTQSATEGVDAEAFDRVAMSEEEAADLDRHWAEAVAVANASLGEMLESASDPGTDWKVTLHTSALANTALKASVEEAMLDYFALALLGKWYRLALPDLADATLERATATLNNAVTMLYRRRRPTMSDYIRHLGGNPGDLGEIQPINPDDPDKPIKNPIN